MTKDRCVYGPMCLGAEVTRVVFESRPEVAVGPKCLGAEVSRAEVTRGRFD